MLRKILLVAIHSAWLAACLPAYLAFWFATGNVGRTQDKVLRRILSTNRTSWFGKKHAFEHIDSGKAFQRAVPLSVYEDYIAAVERIGRGEQEVLTSQSIPFVQPSSGSTSPTKFLPFTSALRRQFQHAIRAWIFDMLRSRPTLMAGKSYWVITPIETATRSNGWKGTIPVNFDDDLNYLGCIDGYTLLLSGVMPPSVGRVGAKMSFKYLTLFFLLRENNLRLISVWNPTFILLLFENIESMIQGLINDIEAGTLNLPDRIDDGLYMTLLRDIKPLKRRAEKLREIWLNMNSSLPDKVLKTWPHMSLISAWADAGAENSIEAVRMIFPGVEIQPKGLIATEAFVTFPIIEKNAQTGGGVLAVRSHFFEFIPYGNDETSHPCLSNELKKGKQYEVVVTTAGGLYRYRLNDIVEVIGFFRQAPVLKFLGKLDHVVDIVGEKLNEKHISETLTRLGMAYGYKAKFQLLAPERHNETFLYTLYLSLDDESLDFCGLRRDLDHALQDNYHYRYCRSIGQLMAPRIFLIDEKQGSPDVIYLNQRSKITRLGDVKPSCVDSSLDWRRHFGGRDALADCERP